MSNDKSSDKSNDKQKVIKVKVRANGKPGGYDISFAPPSTKVSKKNTEMVYQLSEDTPAGMVFTGMRASPSGEMGAPTVSAKGRQIAFNNANSKKETMAVTLAIGGEVDLEAVPEVINDPQPSPP